MKICRQHSAYELEDKMAVMKEKHDRFVMELREKVKIEEMERDRCEFKKGEHLEFIKFKEHKRKKWKNNLS